MSNDRKYNAYVIAFTVTLSLAIYFFFEAKCFGSCNTSIIKPLFLCVVGLIPSLLILLWRGELFISWLRHVAWWFFLLTLFEIATIDPLGGGGILSVSRQDVAIYSMSILFVITLIYAIVMKKKIVNNS